MLKSYKLLFTISSVQAYTSSEIKYPSLYKQVLVSPVPEVNPPENVEMDFRQISVLPFLGKVLEKVQILLNRDAFKVKENDHAFSHGRSTVISSYQ